MIEFFCFYLEDVVNMCLMSEMIVFFDYEKYGFIGFNIGNLWSGLYEWILCIEFGEFYFFIFCDCNGEFM